MIDRIDLIPAAKLGFGLMRLPLTDPNDDSSIDIEESKKMVDLFIQRGFTYFDTAWMYHDYASEDAVKEILTSRYPRDAYTLADKLHIDYIHDGGEKEQIFQDQLRRTGVSYFDYYLIHDLNTFSYPEMKEIGAFDWLIEKKRAGLVKHIGFSYHDDERLLDTILTEFPEAEFVQLQLNYLDWESEGIRSRLCYETAVRHGKKVIVMEPVKGGTLVNLPRAAVDLQKSLHPDWSAASWAIRFAATPPEVMMVLSGMSSMEQLADNTSFMAEAKPLNAEELEALKKVVYYIRNRVTIPCTGCAYCTSGCPANIPIPKYFSLYNIDNQEPEGKGATTQKEYYQSLLEVFGRASDCIGCGQCESICPQHLPIRDYLKDVAQYFE